MCSGTKASQRIALEPTWKSRSSDHQHFIDCDLLLLGSQLGLSVKVVLSRGDARGILMRCNYNLFDVCDLGSAPEAYQLTVCEQEISTIGLVELTLKPSHPCYLLRSCPYKISVTSRECPMTTKCSRGVLCLYLSIPM